MTDDLFLAAEKAATICEKAGAQAKVAQAGCLGGFVLRRVGGVFGWLGVFLGFFRFFFFSTVALEF